MMLYSVVTSGLVPGDIVPKECDEFYVVALGVKIGLSLIGCGGDMCGL